MTTDEQDLGLENDSKKAPMAAWSVKLDQDTKNLVSGIMANSGLSGAQFVRSLCESFTNEKAITAKEPLPEDLKFLDTLTSRLRSFVMSQYNQYSEAKLQLKEEAEETKKEKEFLKEKFDYSNQQLVDCEMKLHKALVFETKLTEVEKSETNLLNQVNELKKQQIDLDLWKKQVESVNLKDEKIVGLEKTLEIANGDLNKERQRNSELNVEIKNIQNNFEFLNKELEKQKSGFESEIQKQKERFEFEKQGLAERFELEKRMLLEKMDLEKRNAVLEYIQLEHGK